MPLPPALLKLSERLTDEGGTLTIDYRFAPDDSERRQLQAFISDVDAALKDDRPNKMQPIKLLMADRASAVGSDTDAKAKAAACAIALRDLPWWAIANACEDYICGRVPGDNREFMPSAANLATRARGHVEALRADQYRARRLLKAQPVSTPSVAEREAVQAQLAGLAADLRRTNGEAA